MVTINGEAKPEAVGCNLKTFLEQEGYEMNKVVVERNLEIVPRMEVGNVIIQDQDAIEVLRFVGGG